MKCLLFGVYQLINIIIQFHIIKNLRHLNHIKINVLEYTGSLDKDYDKNKLVSAYYTRSGNENVVNLLLLKDGNTE